MKREELFSMAREDRQRMTADAILGERLRVLVADRIAMRIVENTNSYRKRCFFVISDRKPVPFPVQWHRKNTSGVTFARDAIADARAWVAQALLAGFTVFYSSTKGTWGAGRNLEHGIYSEDRYWLAQELKALDMSPC